jgi:hypothetical protein
MSCVRRRSRADRARAATARITSVEFQRSNSAADEWLVHGTCDRNLNEIAARAGACRSLTKQTIRLAEALGLITVQRRPRSGRKHLTNIVRIIRAEWGTNQPATVTGSSKHKQRPCG